LYKDPREEYEEEESRVEQELVRGKWTMEHLDATGVTMVSQPRRSVVEPSSTKIVFKKKNRNPSLQGIDASTGEISKFASPSEDSRLLPPSNQLKIKNNATTTDICNDVFLREKMLMDSPKNAENAENRRVSGKFCYRATGRLGSPKSHPSWAARSCLVLTCVFSKLATQGHPVPREAVLTRPQNRFRKDSTKGQAPIPRTREFESNLGHPTSNRIIILTNLSTNGETGPGVLFRSQTF
jgi:hypothetical protein